ncbi:MAG: bifunctional [glutamine synthetase] adenylyltransferase/[glutamine synthetase]-adenylyl-L-tyrosine phosphorylase [Proteobacteria bacterium]|nr:bifunctional [glutamine synthetase] adenylyltransferase/[glutamine synthetase]-adenylyl-L-tyrosine phosphorylase [Pseudomonadota bacterium]
MKKPARRRIPPKNRVSTPAAAREAETAPAVAARSPGRAWLDDFGQSAAARALARYLAAAPPAATTLTRIAQGSPFLWDLARADPARLLRLLTGDPDTGLADLLARVATAVAAATQEAAAMRTLRRMKAQAALLIALADVGDVWELERVTQAVSEVADAAVRAAVRFLLRALARDGQIDMHDAARPEHGCGYVVLAMGKLGASELNYSSDIDLIVFYDREAGALGADVDAASLYTRLTRGLVKLLQERTGDGYVFRVDLRLRPDPASTQIAISRAAALDYYESVGQNWERAAMIKARPVAGDLALGEAILRDLAPFVWRKYLDFAAVAAVHAMKRQIQAYRGHGDIAIEGHNIKIGRGGIREIEFFVQTQQLIAGGRNPQLRGRETLPMLRALAEGGWIDASACTELTAAYRFLRKVEHRLQMVGDEQTHTLPATPEEVGRFAGFLGLAGRDALAAQLVAQLRVVQRHYASLFEHEPARAANRRGLVFPAQADERETLDKLSVMGWHDPPAASATIRGWLGGGKRALRGETVRAQFAQILPVLVDELAATESPDAAVVAFDRFLTGLRGGAQLFSLLGRNPDLVFLIALILGTAPRLADILAHSTQVMDALIDPRFFGVLPDAASLVEGLDRSLAQSDSYEDLLDRVRQFGQEQSFLVGARVLSGTVSAAQAGEAFASIADAVIGALRRAVGDMFAATYGRVEGAQSAILAMGKLGGREMTAASDLDLIVIFDFDADRPQSLGGRSLHANVYFARLTQRLVSALAAPTNYGKLYDVDMRLRPSGRSGPVATSLAAFASYQESDAWTWEHLSLTRARVVAATPAFAGRVNEVINSVLRRARDPDMVAEDVVEMRRAIAAENGDGGVWDLKYAAGGLIDLEFIAQYLQLVHAATQPRILDTSTARVFDAAARLGLIRVRDAEALRAAVRLYHDLTQVLRLCLAKEFTPTAAGPGLLRLLARAADLPDFATLEAHLAETQARVRASFARILGADA